MKNEIYLQKRLKVLTPVSSRTLSVKETRRLVASINKNIESLGYSFSEGVFDALTKLSESDLTSFYQELIPILKKMRGAHRQFNPIYPNFPKQVMDASEFELYFNALVHYWSAFLQDVGVMNETILPVYEKKERLLLSEKVKLDLIDLGDEKDFESIFTTLLSVKSSISQSDKDVISWFVDFYSDKVTDLLPAQIPMKENLGLIAGLLLNKTSSAAKLSSVVKTATDVLRIAVAFSKGDVSLAENTKFAKFKRKERRFLLGLLESCGNIEEDMLRYSNVWIKLGEILHPGEYAAKFPKAFQAFNKIRNGIKIKTFNSNVEFSLGTGDVKGATKLLSNRPGDFARRLDHLIRSSDKKGMISVTKGFLKVADKVSTPVLLQVYSHFKNRESVGSRVVFPKGALAKMQVLPNTLPKIDGDFCSQFSDEVRDVLVKRFAEKGKLGKVYLDSGLKDYLVPFSQRSAAKALKTIVRGSKIDLDDDYDTIRFFVWWKNGDQRTDIDLTAGILDENWSYKSDISYYNLKDFAGCHSGDITDAPKGAAEFIDISMDRVLKNGGRYIVMSVYCFTSQSFCDLPECFAGWMGRKSAQSGEIFEAKTVKNRIDIAADTRVSIPLVIDCLERKVIWCDIGLKQRPTFNNYHNNRGNISLVCKAMTELKKTNLHDLFSMHVEGRGKLVKDKSKADISFSVDDGTPFETDKIMAEYL